MIPCLLWHKGPLTYYAGYYDSRIFVVLAMSQAAEAIAQISQKMLSIWGTADSILPEELDPREVWWRDRYMKLSDRGYLLRSRYSPQWIPSWKASNKNWEDCEDGKRIEVCIFSLSKSKLDRMLS